MAVLFLASYMQTWIEGTAQVYICDICVTHYMALSWLFQKLEQLQGSFRPVTG